MNMNINMSSKKVAVVIVVIAVLSGTFYAGYRLRGQRATNDQAEALTVGQSFVSNIADNKRNDAYGKFSSKKFQDGQTFSEFSEATKSLVSSTTDNSSASVYIGSGTAIYLQPISNIKDSPDGKKQGLVNLILEKENNEWKVLSSVVQ